jgi:hypothetical protein
MTSPSSSAQAPIAVDVERARRDFRRERQLRFFRGLRLVLLVVVPLALLIVFGDISVASLLSYNERALQAEPRDVLKCLADNAASVTPWSGREFGEHLRGTCFTDAIGYKTRPRFNYDYEDRGGGLFVAVSDFEDMRGDLWVVDASTTDHDAVNCIDRVPVRGFFSLPPAPSQAAPCTRYWSTSPP